jgi:hypothetical protein
MAVITSEPETRGGFGILKHVPFIVAYLGLNMAGDRCRAIRATHGLKAMHFAHLG